METDQPCFSANRIDVFGKCDEYRAASFYQEHGVQQIAGAYEKERVEDAVLMFCKHCLRYSMGWCPIHHACGRLIENPISWCRMTESGSVLSSIARIVK